MQRSCDRHGGLLVSKAHRFRLRAAFPPTLARMADLQIAVTRDEIQALSVLEPPISSPTMNVPPLQGEIPQDLHNLV